MLKKKYKYFKTSALRRKQLVPSGYKSYFYTRNYAASDFPRPSDRTVSRLI